MAGGRRPKPAALCVALVAVAGLLMLSACGDSGSGARATSTITGAGSTTDTSDTVRADGRTGRGDGEGDDDRDDRAPDRPNGRSEAVVEGVIADLAGRCPSVRFTVAGLPVQTHKRTQFARVTCATLASGDVVKVEGLLGGRRNIFAREVELEPGPAPTIAPADGVTVALVASTGTIAASATTNSEGRFQIRNTTPGSYELRAALAGAGSCTIWSGITLVGEQNGLAGRIGTTARAGTCALVLVDLEVKGGTLR